MKKKIKALYKLISKINIKIHIENNPENINNNKLGNFDPDLLQAAGGDSDGNKKYDKQNHKL